MVLSSPGVRVVEVDWDPICYKGIPLFEWYVILRYLQDDPDAIKEVQEHYLLNKAEIDKSMENDEFQFAILPGETEKQAYERYNKVRKAADQKRYERYNKK